MRAVAGDVDLTLGLFDPHAELERLRLDRHAATQQHAISIAGAMADRKDCEVGVDTTGTRQHSTQTAVDDVKVFDAARKPDFAAQLFKLPAQRADDQRQPI